MAELTNRPRQAPVEVLRLRRQGMNDAFDAMRPVYRILHECGLDDEQIGEYLVQKGTAIGESRIPLMWRWTDAEMEGHDAEPSAEALAEMPELTPEQMAGARQGYFADRVNKFNPIADLRFYVLQSAARSTCGVCGQPLFLLAPREAEHGHLPFYYLCLCGRIAQAGHSQEIAPREKRG